MSPEDDELEPCNNYDWYEAFRQNPDLSVPALDVMSWLPAPKPHRFRVTRQTLRQQ